MFPFGGLEASPVAWKYEGLTNMICTVPRWKPENLLSTTAAAV
jgi:hypothetical protein